MRKYFLILFVLFFAWSNLSAEEKGVCPSLVVAYEIDSSTDIEPDSYNIIVYLKMDTNKYFKIFTTYNSLEYFEYQGQLKTKDGDIYVTFKDYSIPAGMTKLFFFKISDLSLYYSDYFEETLIPQHFTLSTVDKTINVLSIDVGSCGELYSKPIHSGWKYNMDSSFEKEVSSNYSILYEINISQ